MVGEYTESPEQCHHATDNDRIDKRAAGRRARSAVQRATLRAYRGSSRYPSRSPRAQTAYVGSAKDPLLVELVRPSPLNDSTE
jgi:hypothetical protein